MRLEYTEQPLPQFRAELLLTLDPSLDERQQVLGLHTHPRRDFKQLAEHGRHKVLVVGIDRLAVGGYDRLGVLCGLGAAACYAGFLLSIRKLQADQQGATIFSVLTMVSLTTAAILALEVLRSGASFVIPDHQSLAALMALGFFSQFAGWIMITNALPFVRASLSGLILLLQPALAFVWDVLFFQRPTSLLNWAGVSIALVAIYLGTFRPAQTRPKMRSGQHTHRGSGLHT